MREIHGKIVMYKGVEKMIEGCDERDCSCPCLKIKEYVSAPPEERYICEECGHNITNKEVLRDILTKEELDDFLHSINAG